MKKFLLCFLLGFWLCTGMAGCAGGAVAESANRIQPAEFSGDAQEILNILEHKLNFFDYTVDDSLKSFALTSWVYQDGQWSATLCSYGNLTNSSDRFGLYVQDTAFEWIEISDTGHVKTSFPREASWTSDENIASMKTLLSQPAAVEARQEIPLWAEWGTMDGSSDFSANLFDFKTADCDFGFAITITFSEQAITDEKG